MEQRRLEYFITVAEELNFTRAAQRLHVTQSTLSAGIKTLENELKVELLTRSTRTVSLTDAGAAFLPEARAALEALDRARAAIEPTSAGLRGNLTVGMLSGLTIVDVPALAGDFHRRHPGVRFRIEMSQRGTRGLLDRIRESHIDVAFVGANVEDEHLKVVPIKKYVVELLVPKDHSLARRESVRLHEIGTDPLIEMPIGFGQRAAVDDAFATANLSRRISIEVSDITTIPQYVAHGLGLALLPPEFVQPSELLVRAVPIVDTQISWQLSAVTSASRAPTRALYAFMDLIPHYIRHDRVF